MRQQPQAPKPKAHRTQISQNFSTTSDSHLYLFNGLFGGWKELNKRGFIQIGPYKPLKRAPKDYFFLRSYETSRFLNNSSNIVNTHCEMKYSG